jgi:Putative translation factor (SUA5)
MSQYFEIHPETPQPRLIQRAVEIIQSGGLIVYPSGTTYALACGMAEKNAVDRIRQLRGLDDDHHFTLACRDLSDIGSYTRVDNTAFRLLKAHTPGPIHLSYGRALKFRNAFSTLSAGPLGFGWLSIRWRAPC